ELAGEDREFLPRIVREFFAHADRAVASLRQAALRRDAAEVRFTAHGLKGSAGSLGARGLAALCADLEARARTDALGDAVPAVEAIAAEAQRVRSRLAPFAPDRPPRERP
ncbi:MAG TPA: Hpt domain-containing protein, partial [Planctomycetota bacterium]|nr:Hpt domain-containing protein [Planctomycetota bacterium]